MFFRIQVYRRKIRHCYVHWSNEKIWLLAFADFAHQKPCLIDVDEHRGKLLDIASDVGCEESAVRELAEQLPLLRHDRLLAIDVDDVLQHLEEENAHQHLAHVAFEILEEWSNSKTKEATTKNLHEALKKHFPEVAKELEPFLTFRNGKNTSKVTNQLNAKTNLLVLRERLEFDQSNCSC